MRKITNYIWFDTHAKQAADFYKDVFGAKITSANDLSGTPSGNVSFFNLEIAGEEFTFMNAGPYFKPNPSISFTVACSSQEEADTMWKKLVPDGKVMMEMSEYPFATRYGWIEDKFGLSWQISFMEGAPIKQKVTPSLLFVGDVCGKAEEAIMFYTSVFHDSAVGMISHYEKGMEPNTEQMINYGAFTLEKQDFIAMDSALKHEFTFSEGISFLVTCKDQAEIDYFWEKLSAVPEAEQCGWLKDKYGVSWQIVPEEMNEMLEKGDDAAKGRVTQAFLKMKKFDVAVLREAFNG